MRVTPDHAVDEVTDRIDGSSTPVIELRGIQKKFGDNTVVCGVDLSILAGEHVSIIGPSGSGKSTLLRCMNLLEKPSAGTVRVAGNLVHSAGQTRGERSLVPLRRQVGMVFQGFNLFPHLTAIDNVTLGLLHSRQHEPREVLERGVALLRKVGLGDKLLAFPHELSGGQQQRVAIARALAPQPIAILFDEPTSALDPELVAEVLTVMKEIADEGMTMVVVTHEFSFAADFSHRVIFLDSGSVVEEGPPAQLFKDPVHDRTRRFISQILGDGASDD